MNQNPTSNTVWKDKLTWFKSSSQYKALDTIDGEPMGFEWNILPGYTTLQLCYKVQEFLFKIIENQKNLQDGSSSCRCSTTSHGDLQTMNMNAKKRPTRFDLCEKIFTRKMVIPRTWIRKKWYSTCDSKPQGKWNRVAELMMTKFIESRHPVFRSTSPLSRGVLKSKGGGKLSKHFCAETVFSHNFFSDNQLSIHGAVSDLCEECKSCNDGTGRLVLVGQSEPLFVPKSSLMKTPTPSTDDPAQEDLLQEYQERVERQSQQDRVIKFCIDTGFPTMVNVAQYFMTKDTEEFSQFTDSVACREYILPRDEKSSEPTGWIRGNTQIGPVLESTNSYLQGKYGVEIRIEL